MQPPERLNPKAFISYSWTSPLIVKADQTKFIPIACELDERGEPYLPQFFKNRIALDFSSLERASENWERLIRILHGKPALTEPTLNKPPAQIDFDVPRARIPRLIEALPEAARKVGAGLSRTESKTMSSDGWWRRLRNGHGSAKRR